MKKTISTMAALACAAVLAGSARAVTLPPHILVTTPIDFKVTTPTPSKLNDKSVAKPKSPVVAALAPIVYQHEEGLNLSTVGQPPTYTPATVTEDLFPPDPNLVTFDRNASVGPKVPLVPDGGSTAGLFGLALAGTALARRKLAA